MRLLARVFGVRTVVGPEAVRVTMPAWMVKLMPGILEETRRKVQRARPESVDVRIVGRSVIARLR
jgi:hypothetical protein